MYSYFCTLEYLHMEQHGISYTVYYSVPCKVGLLNAFLILSALF